MTAYFNETLHDKTGSFLYQTIAASGSLSEGACDDIRKLFEDEHALFKFIKANVEVSDLEAWELVDQVFPEPCDTDIEWVDSYGDNHINVRSLM